MLKEKLALKEDQGRKLHDRVRKTVHIQRKALVQKRAHEKEREANELLFSQYRSRIHELESSCNTLRAQASCPELVSRDVSPEACPTSPHSVVANDLLANSFTNQKLEESTTLQVGSERLIVNQKKPRPMSAGASLAGLALTSDQQRRGVS